METENKIPIVPKMCVYMPNEYHTKKDNFFRVFAN